MLFASTETTNDACRIPVTNSCNFLFYLGFIRNNLITYNAGASVLQTHSAPLLLKMTHYVRNLVDVFAFLQIAPFAMHNPLIRMWRHCNAIRKDHTCRYTGVIALVRAAFWQRRISRVQIRSYQLADGDVVYIVQPTN